MPFCTEAVSAEGLYWMWQKAHYANRMQNALLLGESTQETRPFYSSWTLRQQSYSADNDAWVEQPKWEQSNRQDVGGTGGSTPMPCPIPLQSTATTPLTGQLCTGLRLLPTKSQSTTLPSNYLLLISSFRLPPPVSGCNKRGGERNQETLLKLATVPRVHLISTAAP